MENKPNIQRLLDAVNYFQCDCRRAMYSLRDGNEVVQQKFQAARNDLQERLDVLGVADHFDFSEEA